MQRDEYAADPPPATRKAGFPGGAVAGDPAPGAIPAPQWHDAVPGRSAALGLTGGIAPP